MAYIANVAYDRNQVMRNGEQSIDQILAGHRINRFIPIGALWLDGDKAGVKLDALCMGTWVAKPFDMEAQEWPYLEGDLQVETGEYIHEGSLRKRMQTVGFIQTSQETDKRTLYWGAFFVIPIIEDAKAYVWASIKEAE